MALDIYVSMYARVNEYNFLRTEVLKDVTNILYLQLRISCVVHLCK